MTDWRKVKLSPHILRRDDGAELYRVRTVVADKAGRLTAQWRYRAAWSAGTLADGPDWAGKWRATQKAAERDLQGKRESQPV